MLGCAGLCFSKVIGEEKRACFNLAIKLLIKKSNFAFIKEVCEIYFIVS
jgi:hypothetical protein